MGWLRSAAAGVSLRARLTLIAALAVAIAVAGIALAAYVTVSRQLRSQEDSSLQTQLRLLHLTPSGRLVMPPSGNSSGSVVQEFSLQVIDSSGVSDNYFNKQLSNPTDFSVAVSGNDVVHAYSHWSDGTRVRVLVVPLPGDQGLVVARNISGDAATLDHLRLLLFFAGGIGVLFAAAGGLLVSRSGLRPVDRLTAAAEHIARTEELDVPIEVVGSDELARLAKAFNSMTSALSSSRERQQQLVADAGHELRTPLTSMRTNLDLLIRSEKSGRALPPEDRDRLLEDLALQMAELGTLVGELVNLARDDRAIEPTVPVDFAEIIERAVERARLRSDGLIDVDLQPWPVLGRPAELERAVVNLLDNAVKFSPADEPVLVRLSGGVLTVTDRGPGLSDEDRPHVFERFYRSTSARGMPGSGLGLAIVAQTVMAHGGTVALEPGLGGGTTARLVLPPLLPGEVTDLSEFLPGDEELAATWSRAAG